MERVLVIEADLAEFTPTLSHAGGADVGGMVSLGGFWPPRMRDGRGAALLNEGVPDGSLLGASKLWTDVCSGGVGGACGWSDYCVIIGSYVMRYLHIELNASETDVIKPS